MLHRVWRVGTPDAVFRPVSARIVARVGGLVLAECRTRLTPGFREQELSMRTITSICVVLALCGCEAKNDTSTDRGSSERAVAADNTDKNERDQKVNALTPGDQGESEADRTITQRARQNVVAEDGLSVNAKNVKIITRSGVVTLRGPVASQAEKLSIVRLVKSVDGVQRVDDQLEVAGNETTSAKTNRAAD
jgi:hyperosmotically inducible periplasmic protein